MPRVYYVGWIDPATGFYRRVDFDDHAEAVAFERDLRRKGVKHVQVSSFER